MHSGESLAEPLFHQVRFAPNSLMAVSALFLTLATAASIPSVVLLRRLRIRRAKSLVEIATRFRGGFGRYVVPMAMLHSIRTSHQTNFSSPTRSYEDESAHLSALPPKADMCGATRDVRFGPKPTSRRSLDQLVGELLEMQRHVKVKRLCCL